MSSTKQAPKWSTSSSLTRFLSRISRTLSFSSKKCQQASKKRQQTVKPVAPVVNFVPKSAPVIRRHPPQRLTRTILHDNRPMPPQDLYVENHIEEEDDYSRYSLRPNLSLFNISADNAHLHDYDEEIPRHQDWPEDIFHSTKIGEHWIFLFCLFILFSLIKQFFVLTWLSAVWVWANNLTYGYEEMTSDKMPLRKKWLFKNHAFVMKPRIEWKWDTGCPSLLSNTASRSLHVSSLRTQLHTKQHIHQCMECYVKDYFFLFLFVLLTREESRPTSNSATDRTREKKKANCLLVEVKTVAAHTHTHSLV